MCTLYRVALIRLTRRRQYSMARLCCCCCLQCYNLVYVNATLQVAEQTIWICIQRYDCVKIETGLYTKSIQVFKFGEKFC